MEYSLNHLNSISNLKELTFSNFINSLNLIGLEIDEISKKKKTNSYSSLENIKVVIKIPANREDLLIEDFFIEEISSIFFFNILNLWKTIKKNYNFLLKQKYFQYSNYSTIIIKSELTSIVTYAIELEKFQDLNTPLWVKTKLSNLGIEPLNNFNDILNLVISEWGQLLNIAKISNENSLEYSLHRLQKIDYFLDNQGNTIELLPGTIVLRDFQNNILTVLGILNLTKKNSHISKVIIESTFYNIEENKLLINIINPKISLKYFRKMFLEKLKFSFQRLLTLIEILNYSAQLIPIKYSTQKQKNLLTSHRILILKKKTFTNILGIEKINEDIFQQAGLKIICKTKKFLYFKIPNCRKDLIREIDLIEEYSRFFGYKNFKEIIPVKNFSVSLNKNENIQFLKEIFISFGFYEILTNSLNDIGQTNLSSISLTNPLNKELSTLRQTLIPKILDIFSINLRTSSNSNNLFEIGRVFNKYNNQIIEEEKITGIFQLPKIFISKDSDLEWFSSIGFLERILSDFGYKEIEKENIFSEFSYYHPKRSVVLKDKEKVLGTFGQISPINENFQTLKRPTYCFELNLIHFHKMKRYSFPFVYKEYSKYPKITKDISIGLNKKINFNEIKLAFKINLNYLKDLNFFDIYFDKNNMNSINLGIRFYFQSSIETLTNEIIELEMLKAKNILVSKFQGKIKE